MAGSVSSRRVFEAAPVLAGGGSLFDDDCDPLIEGLAKWRAPPDAVAAAGRALQAEGFSVLAANAFTLTAVAPDGWGQADDIEADAVIALGDFSGSVVLTPTPPHSLHTNALPPNAPYFHLRAPVDMLTALNGTRASFCGHTGKGVRVAVVDSGCDTSHPFFTDRHARIDLLLGPGIEGPNVDTLGHGTMICGSILSLAPEAVLTVIKTDEDLSLAAFKYAAALVPPPQIIQNTWGHITQGTVLTPYERAVYAAVTAAVEDGVIAVFAAGNEKIIFPPQVPAAIAAGGVYVDMAGLVRAADYASGYASVLFAGRNVPDVCGLVGMAPGGVYIMLPTAPGSTIDRALAEYTYPLGDGGQPDDGWVVISGTSSASAQITGTTALLLQLRPDLDAAEVKVILGCSAQRVDVGISAQGSRTGPPYPNRATGWGLVDIDKALALVTASGGEAKGCHLSGRDNVMTPTGG